ncbi:hypothetical protein BDM02DRAFT_363643 [Thelephora ganbajun]|uniref:Uncharacterized protein n=1 Tax=Thelephora ganbajun TaxID=370292 RepID=A0ACB6ZRB1_THEGA|nr:hypothetical protein BDM02DRAFT_363643 [Thelephora ganbajun]
MVNNEKRSTRSQINIPGDLSRISFGLSPLKQARSAIRNADVIVGTDSSGVGSSTGVTSGKKRSASPPAIDKEESVERQLKKSKTFADENEVHESSSPGWKLQAFPSSSNPSALPPPSVSSSTPPTRSVGSSPRARSVPPSIPTTPGQVPYLDLSKYRSPTKSAHRVRVMSVPPLSPLIRDGGESGEGVRMGKAMDRDLDKTPIPRMMIEKVVKVRRILDHPPPTLVVASTSGLQNDDPFSHELDVLPKTPVQGTRSLLESMSSRTLPGSLDISNQSLLSSSLLPNNDATDSMILDPPAPSPQPQPQPPPEPKREPRLGLTRQSSHLIPPQPKPLSFPLPSRSPTPPSQRVSRSRSVPVEPPIPALPYPLLPSTSSASNGPAPEPESVPPVAPTISDPQPPEKHDSSGITPSTMIHTTTETVTLAPLPLPAPDTAEPNEKGKSTAKERTPGPSKLPAAKSTKASRLRSATTNPGPSGVTRTRATKAAARPTPISREGRVTRSSTAKSRQASVLKEKEASSTNQVTKPKEGDGDTGTGKKDNEGKDGASAGINIVRLTLVLGHEPDIRVSNFQRLRQRRLRQSRGNRWALLCPPSVRRPSRDLPPQPSPSRPYMDSRLLEDPMNLALPPP